MANFDSTQIAGTLYYGVFWRGSRKKILTEYAILVLTILLSIVFVVIMLVNEQNKTPNSTALFVVDIVLCVGIFSSLIVVVTVLVVRNERIRNRIELWLKDAIEAEAYSRSIDKKVFNLGLSELIKIEVQFEIDGVHYVRTSENEYKSALFFGKPYGYLQGLSRYVDRNIIIMYSPAYDKVMIVRDKKEKKR